MTNKIILITTLAALNTHAATLAQYNFTGGSTADSAAAANITASNVSTSGDVAISSFSATGFIRSHVTSNTLAGAITDADYFEFAITVASGSTMNLSSLSFDHLGSTTTGTPLPYESSLSLFSSIDGFTAANVLGTSTETMTTNVGAASTFLATENVSLSAPSFQNLTGTTTFRIYGYDNQNDNNDILRLDNIILEGTVTSIPEPSSTALLGLGFSTMLLRRRK